MAARESFVPGPDTQLEFRAALGSFATGVTVVTTQTDTGPIGMTANSFSSVSLDPPLVMWCPSKSSERAPFFLAAHHFAIHVIGADQRDLAAGFARAGDDFGDLDLARNDHGCPLINGCIARFECETQAIHDAGDHSIVVGRVFQAEVNDGAPLVFSRGHFGGFQG